MKTCGKCKLEKAEKHFGEDKRTRDGLQHWCKACMHRAAKWQFSGNKKSENTDPDKLAELRREGARIYRLRHPEKVKARKMVEQAVKDGTLEKSPCVICDKLPSEAHHSDYKKPLDITWLCKRCHDRHHRIMEKLG